MTEVWSLAALWLGLALLVTLLSIWIGVATAPSEIVVGTVALLLIGAFLGSALLIANAFFLPRYLLPKPLHASEAAPSSAAVEEAAR